MDVREQILAALAKNELVVIVGAGVSRALSGAATTSTWPGLIADGIDRVASAAPDDGALLAMRLESVKEADDLVSLAEDLKRRLGEDFGRWIDLSVGKLNVVDSALADALGELGAPILTTNYDVLIERALGRGSATWLNPDEMRTVIRGDSTAIGHLHGVCSHVESLIFSNADYTRLTSSQTAQQVQTAAFTMKTFLFVGVGAGLDDPNFSPMIKEFQNRFPASATTHFRLCRDEDVDAATELRSVVDVGFGDAHEDLPTYLRSLAAEARAKDIDTGVKSRALLLDWFRDNSTLWRDAATLSEKSVPELIVDPLFLPEPHDQYATSSVVNTEKNKPKPIDITRTFTDGGIVLIAGEESSGVSTAIAYSLNKGLDLRARSHALLVSDPLVSGSFPIQRVIERRYREWECGPVAPSVTDRLILGVDNLRAETSTRFTRAIDDIKSLNAGLTIVGVRQADAAGVAEALREATGKEVTVVYLGRFSDAEAQELARRVAPGREVQVAHGVMEVIREKNLPRTPFTITLLVELVQAGVALQKEESEIAVLDQYLSLLLGAEFIRTTAHDSMTLRQKRLVLELLAKKLVEGREDKALETRVQDWLAEQFRELGWDNDPRICLQDLVDRRILARTGDGSIRFQRSAYLELMAGIAAREDDEFRSLVLESPLQLASIVRSYAAMTRKDSEVLRVVHNEIARISVVPLKGSVFKSVRRVDAKQELFADKSEADDPGVGPGPGAEAGGMQAEIVQRDGLAETYYDDSDDSDSPAFLTSRIEDLSPARVAMIVLDLASRVLRDSDEVRDQVLKGTVLRDVLIAWVSFTDLYELELAQLDELDDMIASFFTDEEAEAEDLEKLRSFLELLMPSMLTDSGVRFCLSAPSLGARLLDVDLSDTELGSEAALIRVIALWGSGGTRWVDALALLDESAVRTFFCASFLSALARYAYVVDKTLTDTDRDKVRAFLRRVVELRYNFKDVPHKIKVLNDFENKLRRSRLNEGKRGLRAITVG